MCLKLGIKLTARSFAVNKSSKWAILKKQSTKTRLIHNSYEFNSKFDSHLSVAWSSHRDNIFSWASLSQNVVRRDGLDEKTIIVMGKLISKCGFWNGDWGRKFHIP